MAHQLVKEFHRLWSDSNSHRPSHAELQLGESVVAEHGFETCTELLPQVVKLMRRGFAEARWFGATQTFWPQALKQRKRKVESSQRLAAVQLEHKQDQKTINEQKQRRKESRLLWEKLTPADQDDIRKSVLTTANGIVRRKLTQKNYDDPLVEFACHRELESRLASQSIVL